jgi:hypothetical protein
MAIVYVSPGLATGDDDGTTAANDFRSWAKFATAGCAAGSDVRVNNDEASTAAVTFNNTINGTVTAPTTITGYSTDWATPTLRFRNGAGAGANIDGIIFNNTVSQVILSYIEIKNYTRDGYRGTGTVSSDICFMNCSFHNNSANGFNINLASSLRWRIINTLIYSNGASGITGAAGMHLLVRRCKIYSNVTGIGAFTTTCTVVIQECIIDSNTTGISTPTSSYDLYAKNCVIDRNTTGINIPASAVRHIFVQCRITNNTTGIVVAASVTVSTTMCAFYGNGTRQSLGAGATLEETSNVDMAADGYVNGAGQNYNLVNGATPAECRWTASYIGDTTNAQYWTAGFAPNPDFPAVSSTRAPDTTDGVVGTQEAQATDADYLALEANRNKFNVGSGVADLLVGKGVVLAGVDNNGTRIESLLGGGESVKHTLFMDENGHKNPLRVDCYLSNNGVPITGATLEILIKRLSDGYFWVSPGFGFGEDLPDPPNEMVEDDDENYPGYYYFEIPAALLPNDVFVAIIKYTVSETDYYKTHIFETVNRVMAGADLLDIKGNAGTVNLLENTIVDLGGGKGALLAMAYIDGIYLNYAYGFDENTPPYGTNRLPVNDLVNALVLCSSQKQNEIKVLFGWEEVTIIEEDVSTKKLIGLRPISNDGGFDFQHVQSVGHFENLRIRNNSQYMDRCTFLRCMISGIISLSKCLLDECTISAEGEIRPLGGQTEIIRKATFVSSAPYSSFNFMDATTGTVYLFGCQGILSLSNLITAEVVNIIGFKGRITKEESCYAGTINIYGPVDELVVHPSIGATDTVINRYEETTANLRQIEGEISGKRNSTLGLLMTASGAPLSVAVASVDLELMREADGYREKRRVMLTKASANGFYTIKIKDYFTNLTANRVYSYCISSGDTTVDSTVGTLRVTDSVTGTEILERVNNLQRYFDQQGKFLKKELTNAAPQSKNA